MPLVTELLILLIPIFLTAIITVYTGSGMLGGLTAYLSLAYISINSGNSLLFGAFVLITTFIGLAVGVYMTRLTLGET